MAKQIAATDPRTLAAAFNAHAQRTACGKLFCKRVRPVGNGMPIRKPAGAIRQTVTSAFKGNGHPTPYSLTGAARNASAETVTATPINTALSRPVSLDSPVKPRLQ